MQQSKTALRGPESYAAPVATKVAPKTAGRRAVKSSSANVLERLEDRRLMTSTLDIGMMVSDSSATAASKIVPMLNNTGTKGVRLWYTVNDWNSRSVNGALAMAKTYSDAGFDVDMVINPGGGKDPGYTAAYNWFSWAANNSTLKTYIDKWEIGNEPDHAQYWNSTNYTSYVNDLLKPAYAALHATGEEVISAAPSWNAADVQGMINNNGLLNYCDYIGFHPYANGVDGVKSSVAAINKVVAGRKPIAATEWNVRGISDKNAWAAAVAAVYPTIKAGFALNYYFTSKVINTPAGPAGVLNTDWSYNTPFYNAVSTFKYVGGFAGSGSVVTTPTPTPTPTPTTPTGTGNTAAGTGSIYGTLFDDSNSNGTKDASEKNSSGTFTVFLDANGNAALDAGEKTTQTDASGNYAFTGLAKGTYNVGAKLPNGYRVNTATGTVATNVASGGKNLNINVAVARGVAVSPTPAPTPTPTPSPTPTSTPTTGAPKVDGLQLLDATTGKVIATYTKNMFLSLASLPTKNIAFAAAVSGTVQSVILEGMGKKLETKSGTGPYTLLGQNASGGLNATAVGKGSYTFGLTAWANGKSSGTFYISITFY